MADEAHLLQVGDGLAKRDEHAHVDLEVEPFDHRLRVPKKACK